MTSRLIHLATDYPILESWWTRHDFPAPTADILPPLGIIIELDGAPIAAGWCYTFDGVPCGMLEWLVANPDFSPRQTFKALELCILSLRDTAYSLGKINLLSTCRQKSLSRLLQRTGFELTDTNVSHHFANPHS